MDRLNFCSIAAVCISLPFSFSSDVSAQTEIPGQETVSFDEAATAFFGGCVGQLPSFRGSRSAFNSLGFSVRTISGGQAHSRKGLMASVGTIDKNVRYCVLRASLDLNRNTLVKKFEEFVEKIEPAIAARAGNRLSVVDGEFMRVYTVESSLSSGWTTLTVISGYKD